MFKNIPQVQSAPITDLKQTHFMGLMTFTKEQFEGFFTASNPAPGKLATQLTAFNQRYDVLDDAYRINSYSLETERLRKADEDCDHTFMGVKKMTAAQQAFDFIPTVKEAADRMMQCVDKFDIDVAEDYLGENNKLQQFLHEIETDAQLTADAQTLGLQQALAQLSEKVTLMRDLLTQRGMAQAPKGAMKSARTAMEPEYRWLIVAFNAYVFVDENPQRFASLVSALNSNIDYLRIHALKNGGETAGEGGQQSTDNGQQSTDNGQQSGGDNGQQSGGDNEQQTGGDDNGQQTTDNGQQSGGDNGQQTGGDDNGGDNPGGDNGGPIED